MMIMNNMPSIERDRFNFVILKNTAAFILDSIFTTRILERIQSENTYSPGISKMNVV